MLKHCLNSELQRAAQSGVRLGAATASYHALEITTTTRLQTVMYTLCSSPWQGTACGHEVIRMDVDSCIWHGNVAMFVR